MKNYQRGSVGFAALIVGTLIIIGLGSWWYMNTSPSQEAVDPSVEVQARKAAEKLITVTSAVQQLGGLVVEDIKVGTGGEAKVGHTLSMHYTGTLDNGTIFDSSIPRGEPFEFTLGAGRVIQGWDKGIVGMKVGGKRKLTIPAELGYGDRDMGAIPPNSTLHFEVELLGVK